MASLFSIVSGKQVQPYMKYIIGAAFLIGVYWYVQSQIKKAKRAKGKRNYYDPNDIDPTFNFQAIANRVHEVFVSPTFGNNRGELDRVAEMIVGLNDSEFILLNNTYNDTFTPETLFLGAYKIDSMREAINYPTWVWSLNKEVINQRFDRLNIY